MMDPRLHFFLVRESPAEDKASGRTLVPLVPADLLPAWIDFAGAPRAIAPGQAKGMVNVGVFPGDGTKEGKGGEGTLAIRSLALPLPVEMSDEEEEDVGEKVEKVVDTAPVPVAITTTDVSSSSATTKKPQSPVSAKAVPPETQKQQKKKDHQRVIKAVSQKETLVPSSSARASTPNADDGGHVSTVVAREPAKGHPQGATSPKRDTGVGSPDRSEHRDAGVVYFCRHWCWHGTCKWGLQCRFKHSMPSTPQGLEQVGLRDFPAWWRSCVGAALAESTGFGLSPGPLSVPLPRSNSGGSHHNNHQSAQKHPQQQQQSHRTSPTRLDRERTLRSREMDRDEWGRERSLKRRQRELAEYEREKRERRDQHLREREGERTKLLGGVGGIGSVDKTAQVQAARKGVAVVVGGAAVAADSSSSEEDIDEGKGVTGGGGGGGGGARVGKTAVVADKVPHLLDV